jgi:hypothetical protein
MALRIHSETFFLLALARAAIAFASSSPKRTDTLLPLAPSSGNFGRPTFLVPLCWLKISKLLKNRIRTLPKCWVAVLVWIRVE